MLTPANLPYRISRSLVSQRSLMTVATMGVLGLTAVGVAAAAPSAKTTDTVKVCVKNSDGSVRYVKSSTTKCGSGQKLITWSAKGADGAAGATGAAGAAGAAGVDGTKILSGAVAPASGVGANGDFYLNTATSLLYGPKAAGAWPAGVSLVGTAGVDGTKILSGAVAPASGVGANGDFYLNTATSLLYGPKAAGAWPAGVSLVGATGPAGAAGVLNWENLSNSSAQTLTGAPADYLSPSCSSGKKVLGGGWTSLPSTAAAQPRIYASYPSSSTAWTVKADNNGSGTTATSITVYVICATA